MEGSKQPWEDYEKILIRMEYTPDQIQEVKNVREKLDLCPYEQFRELFLQGVIVRTAKVKKPRNYFVNESGEFLFLNHFHKKYQVAAKFKED